MEQAQVKAAAVVLYKLKVVIDGGVVSWKVIVEVETDDSSTSPVIWNGIIIIVGAAVTETRITFCFSNFQQNMTKAWVYSFM